MKQWMLVFGAGCAIILFGAAEVCLAEAEKKTGEDSEGSNADALFKKADPSGHVLPVHTEMIDFSSDRLRIFSRITPDGSTDSFHGSMPSYTPNPKIDYKILVMKPDSSIDYKIIRVFPRSASKLTPKYIPDMKPTPDTEKNRKPGIGR